LPNRLSSDEMYPNREHEGRARGRRWRARTRRHAVGYSTTSSARASSDGGTWRPSASGQVDDEIELGRLLHGKIGRVGALEDLST